MISTVFAMASAILLRILLAWFTWLPWMTPDKGAALNGAIVTGALLVLIGFDFMKGIRRSPYWVAVGANVLMVAGFFTFAKSEWWMSFVKWLAAL